MRLAITIERDDARPTFRGISEGMSDKLRMNNAVANAALVPVQRNFRALSQTNRNSFGVRSSFWNRMNSATYADADDSAGYVRMPREVALRYFGGTVMPKKASLLAIPALAAAYGKSPRDFSDLRLAIFTKQGGGKTFALVQNQSQAIRYKRVKGRTKIARGPVSGTVAGSKEKPIVFYWLVPSAAIAPNPEVLPSPEVLGAAVKQGVDGYLRLLARRRKRL